MCHVLIIEDEWVIAEYLADLAEKAGATSIAMAYTEEEAVQAAYENKPDIILSDVVLLSGTGPSAVKAITSEHGRIPVIFITATPDACDPPSPYCVVLNKPINPAVVLDTFRQFVSE